MAANALNFGSKVVFLNGLPFTLPIVASLPGSAVAGDFVYYSVSNSVYYYNGTVWTQLASGGSAANNTLSNLTSPTSVNQSLIPSSAGSQILGSSTDYWGPSYIDQLLDSSGNESVNAFSRFLSDSSGNAQLSWSTSGINLGVDNSLAGILNISNGTSNAHTVISAQNTSTSYNFNLPSTAGTLGYFLTSGGGGSNAMTWTAPTNGTVTSVSVVSSNGFAGTVATATSTPAITIETTINSPVLAGNGTAIIAAPVTGSGSTVVLNASPTFTGTITAAAANFSGVIGANNGITSSGVLLINSGSNAFQIESLNFQRSTDGTNFITETYVDSTTLVDNSGPTAIGAFQFAVASFSGEEIAYVIESADANADRRVGTLRITANGSGTITPSISDMYTESADCGVTWTATESSGIISVNYTTTNQSANRTMRADCKQFRA